MKALDVMFEHWRTDLYNIALQDIGEDLMQQSSWYYTNRSVWRHYFDRGYSPIEAYASNDENCK